MDLKILLPYKVFMNSIRVNRVTVDTNAGSYGFLPQRLDCVAALVPGILTYETATGGVYYVAIDEGVLIKTENEIQVSVRNAIGGADLGKLRETIEREFKNLDENERIARSAVAKLESEFIQSIKKLRQEQ
ncbi:F-type H+-transporting ATPase subunit epsilon [Maribacter orientalis]|uniref:F-type H+-transporting ATPase subunit epsilon n=1 Tax=Maribacter orientalis TaxID=228957 RepID=A0A1H7FHQ1_9FLAO|nr:F0F1 ATP synthase subunit epsilon [Maribacter orientalis]SEK22815.1 F-type H+-transporting ATPase subunit epsilon [Maribacter orientalis]|tara:strand:- start:17188 stop:17580 length:393 start_codon:yes stop_codon:yes gene_type:complete